MWTISVLVFGLFVFNASGYNYTALRQAKAMCVPISRCPDKLARGAKLCGFGRVWCPLQTHEKIVQDNRQGRRFNTIADRQCYEYQKSFPRNYQRSIVNGEKALPKEFPHMAILGTVHQETTRWYCGGSLISNRYVLTAAHCNTHPRYGKTTMVRLGDLNVLETTDDARPEDLNISEFITHPKYQPPLAYHDIALIKLSRDVTFNEYIRPICLETSSWINEKRLAIATGWGANYYWGTVIPDMMKVDLDQFTIYECRNHFGIKKEIPSGILPDIQLCYGGRYSSKDTCRGDSGGPLQLMEGPVFKQIGITSFGSGCGRKGVPAVYTRVSAYVPWIEKIVWGN